MIINKWIPDGIMVKDGTLSLKLKSQIYKYFRVEDIENYMKEIFSQYDDEKINNIYIRIKETLNIK